MGAVLVFDFDGTVSLGDEPVMAYARAAARRLPREDDRRALLAGVASYLRGEPGRVEALDGYYAVAALGQRVGAGTADLGAAYRESRALVGTAAAPIVAPPGLRALLDEARGLAHVVLVTNAPAEGIEGLLQGLGLDGAFDEVIGDAGKPAGMTRILSSLLEQAGIGSAPERLLSIGDIWTNDLAPAAALGCTTFLVDRYGTGAGRPDRRARELGELYPAVREWLAPPPL